MTTIMVRVGGSSVPMAEAEYWVRSYFDTSANRLSRKPYAYPAYDSLATGSHGDALNDGDLLAPTLLNAAPSIAAFYSLQSAREQLEAGLRATPAGVTLGAAVDDMSLGRRMQALVGVLDERRLHGVKLTTVTKILHRKRPDFMPLHDKFVAACYIGTQDPFPMRSEKGRPGPGTGPTWLPQSSAISRLRLTFGRISGSWQERTCLP